MFASISKHNKVQMFRHLPKVTSIERQFGNCRRLLIYTSSTQSHMPLFSTNEHAFGSDLNVVVCRLSSNNSKQTYLFLFDFVYYGKTLVAGFRDAERDEMTLRVELCVNFPGFCLSTKHCHQVTVADFLFQQCY